jgi:hypothetical protein
MIMGANELEDTFLKLKCQSIDILSDNMYS